jgi:predicted nucleic acid-binding protein
VAAEEQTPADRSTAAAIADTGPLLHLAEIGCLAALGAFQRLLIPDLVVDELRRHGVDVRLVDVPELTVSTVPPRRYERVSRVANSAGVSIQAADAQVLALVLARRRRDVVLTDDLALRRIVEGRHVVAVGSVGVLVRASSQGLMDDAELRRSIDALFERSTLYLSKAFRAYVHRLLDTPPTRTSDETT